MITEVVGRESRDEGTCNVANHVALLLAVSWEKRTPNAWPHTDARPAEEGAGRGMRWVGLAQRDVRCPLGPTAGAWGGRTALWTTVLNLHSRPVPAACVHALPVFSDTHQAPISTALDSLRGSHLWTWSCQTSLKKVTRLPLLSEAFLFSEEQTHGSCKTHHHVHVPNYSSSKHEKDIHGSNYPTISVYRNLQLCSN